MEQIQKIEASIQLRSIDSIEDLQEKEHGVGFHLMKLLWKITEQSAPRLDFTLDESCISCGKCERVCTTNRIKLVEGKPHWEGKKCNYCYACFNFCSAQAIGVKYYTKKSGRYHYPSVTWEDIAAQKLT
jgi:MinD superfamily P-loop ATPase